MGGIGGDVPNGKVLIIDRYIPLSISTLASYLPSPSQQPPMSSFRNHRIVIASLFLPTIAVLGESGPPTPERPVRDNVDSTISAVTNRLVAVSDPTKPKPTITTAHNRQLSTGGPLKSIVEDLKDKVHTSFIIVFDSNSSSSSEPTCHTI